MRIIYVGPSLYGLHVSKQADEIWRPPAKQGDILQDALEIRPRQIVLIDGRFHQALSVWHKELCYCLLEGIACIGAASMGALRAAELYRYGMAGIGRVFEMYKAGEEDDSLVAMTYDEETYRPLLPAPIGQEIKQADALLALEFARSLSPTFSVSTTLDKNAITPYLAVVLNRIKGNG